MVARLAAVGVLAVLLCAAFPSVLFGDRTLSASAWLPGVLPTGPVGIDEAPHRPPPMRDVEGAAWVDEPAPHLVRRGLDVGGIGWNESEGLGIPLLGNPNMGALSPLQLPVNLFPSPRMQDLAWLGRALLLAVFTFGLAREIGSTWLGSVVAASALMLSGQTVEWIEHHPLNTDVFVPAALWAALAVPRTGRRGIVALALAIGAGLLGVKPQSAVMAGLFGAAWWGAAQWDRIVARGREASAFWAPSAARCLLGLVLGVGLAAVALLPFAGTWEESSGLVRAGRATQSEWTLPVTSLASLGGRLAVDLQHLPTGGAWRRDEGETPGLPYAGLAVVAGAALGFWSTRRSWLSRVLAITIVLEVMRIHGLLPLPLREVPILGSINFVKYCFPLYLALALLLARGIDSLPPGGAVVAAVLVVVELLWLVPGGWARRVDPYAPAPWVQELRRLVQERPGRLSGDVTLAPPLVSGVLGLRDLRSIDVLTPRSTYDFVSRLVAPSQGVTWILADPDPLLAATGPGSNLADLRWIAARRPLDVRDLPGAVRASTTARRLSRLFDRLTHHSIETRQLGGGIHDGGGDRRFHWTCETPCRFTFELDRAPEHFVAGIAAPVPVPLRVRLGSEPGPAPLEHVPAGSVWHDVWFDQLDVADPTSRLVLEIDSEAPATVFVGGVGPAPAAAEEARGEGRELAFRAEAFARLELRWSDEIAYLYENPGAMGEAAFARRISSVPDREAGLECAASHPGERVACVEDDGRSAGEDGAEGNAGSAEELDPVALGGPGAVRVVRSEPDRLVLEAETSGDRVLLVSRAFAPGWGATVDGSPAALWRADGALMALRVPSGRSRVEIRYAPRLARIGLAVTSASLLALIVLAASALRLGRRRDLSSGEG